MIAHHYTTWMAAAAMPTFTPVSCIGDLAAEQHRADNRD